MADDDLIYLLRRAAEERGRAVLPGPVRARAVHEALADAYDRRARERLAARRDDAV
ncbi:hypothetical protein [Sphingomonas lenta]|uniref:hypothetical protein n=1 Tax=Sphingomonas lenta TaxID=1141887 RepID=UPI0015960633|nr:hypothetical protein [Sphingomonas lenta]